jgi:hypothetical protein
VIAQQQQTARDLLRLPGAVDVKIDLQDFGIDLVLAGLLGWALAVTYVYCGTSLSNRKSFARNFVLLAMTTCLIITIVKANLALSLGLVGALSIVRFRSAIKEPEELAYLFISIAIGLGLGANQRGPTFIALAVILALIWMRRRTTSAEESQNLLITVHCDGPGRVRLEQVVETLRRSTSALNIRRFDEDGDRLEASFVADFDDFETLNRGKEELRELSPSLRVSFLENKGLS